MPSVQDVMTRQVRTLAPQHTLAEAARLMDELNVGVIPVCQGVRLLGIVTLGDIAAKTPQVESEVASSLGDISEPAEPDLSGPGTRG